MLMSFELFRDVVKWVAANDALINELDAYKSNKADWSRRKTRELCFRVEFATSKYLETKENFRSKDKKIGAISNAVSVVAYDYIHSDSPITDQVNMARGWKYLKFSLRFLAKG